MKKIKVLSLFDGISVAQQALKELGYDVDYYASEIDKYATEITKKNFPKTIQLGDVKNISPKKILPTGLTLCDCPIFIDGLPEFDLLIGGSPCQDLSIAKKNRQGLDGARSGLFWEYVRILKEVKPKYFVLENVASMSKEAKDTITEALGVEPIMINASLVSAQNRKRLFWTNIPNVTLPEDRGIYLMNILETDENIALQFRRTYWRENRSGKVPALTANMGTGGDNVPYVKSKTIRTGGRSSGVKDKHNWDTYKINGQIRKLTPIECERLQSLPDNYTEGISNTQRYKCLGNAFNKEVVKHILSFIK